MRVKFGTKSHQKESKVSANMLIRRNSNCNTFKNKCGTYCPKISEETIFRLYLKNKLSAIFDSFKITYFTMIRSDGMGNKLQKELERTPKNFKFKCEKFKL